MYYNNVNRYDYNSERRPVQYVHSSGSSASSYQPGYNKLTCNGYAAPVVISGNTSVSEFINRVVQRNEAVKEMTRECAERYNEIQARVDSDQAWLDNQNGLQRFFYGISGETKRVERAMERNTRESVGVLAKAVNALYYQINMNMDAIAELGNRLEMQEAENNRQKQIFLDALRKLR